MHTPQCIPVPVPYIPYTQEPGPYLHDGLIILGQRAEVWARGLGAELALSERGRSTPHGPGAHVPHKFRGKFPANFVVPVSRNLCIVRWVSPTPRINFRRSYHCRKPEAWRRVLRLPGPRAKYRTRAEIPQHRMKGRGAWTIALLIAFVNAFIAAASPNPAYRRSSDVGVKHCKFSVCGWGCDTLSSGQIKELMPAWDLHGLFV